MVQKGEGVLWEMVRGLATLNDRRHTINMDKSGLPLDGKMSQVKVVLAQNVPNVTWQPGTNYSYWVHECIGRIHEAIHIISATKAEGH